MQLGLDWTGFHIYWPNQEQKQPLGFIYIPYVKGGNQKLKTSMQEIKDWIL
jgi:hypothetical protein